MADRPPPNAPTLDLERRLAALEVDHALLRIQMRIQYLVFAQMAQKDTLDACDYFAWERAQEARSRIATSETPLAEVAVWWPACRMSGCTGCAMPTRACWWRRAWT